MGIVRRHPFLTFVFLLGALPVLGIIAIQVAQHTPACRAWQAEVDSRANVDRKVSTFVEYDRGDMSVDQYFGNLRAQAAHEMRDTRPLFCK